ncbi:MAG: hypothetical protein AB7U35_12235 [Sphingobium sp.]
MNDEIHVSGERARAGETPHIVRYVLVISTLLAAIAMTIAWVTGALTSDDGANGNETPVAARPQPDSVPRSSDDLIDESRQSTVDDQKERYTAPAE